MRIGLIYSSKYHNQVCMDYWFIYKGGFLGLVLLFGVKVMVKWGFIIYVWR